jgi:heme-degrading monooxygenase HmoA
VIATAASGVQFSRDSEGGFAVVRLSELDGAAPFAKQLGDERGPIVVMNVFRVSPQDEDVFMEAWTVDGEFMKRQPGCISTQLHRGIAGSHTFVNVVHWESTAAFRTTASNPDFQARLSRYPDSAVASPHIFTRVAVPEICGD